MPFENENRQESRNEATRRCIKTNEARNGTASPLEMVFPPGTSVIVEAKPAPAKTMGHPTTELSE